MPTWVFKTKLEQDKVRCSQARVPARSGLPQHVLHQPAVACKSASIGERGPKTPLNRVWYPSRIKNKQTLLSLPSPLVRDQIGMIEDGSRAHVAPRTRVSFAVVQGKVQSILLGEDPERVLLLLVFAYCRKHCPLKNEPPIMQNNKPSSPGTPRRIPSPVPCLLFPPTMSEYLQNKTVPTNFALLVTQQTSESGPS